MAPDTRSGPGQGAATAEQAGQTKIIPPPGTGRVNSVDAQASLAETEARMEQLLRDRPELQERQRQREAEEAARRAANDRAQQEQQQRIAAAESARKKEYEEKRRQYVAWHSGQPAELRALLHQLGGVRRWDDHYAYADCPLCRSEGALMVEADQDSPALWCKRVGDEDQPACDEDAILAHLGLPTEADRDSTKIWGRKPKPLEWLIEPIFARGWFVSIVGAKKVGKSLLMLGWAIQLAEAERVLYLDKENTEDEIDDRVGDMRLEPSSNLVYRHFPKVGALDTPAGAAEFVRSVTASGARVVFVDTWSKFIAGPEAAPETHTRAYEMAIIPLRERGITVVVGDHLGKDPKAGPRGGSSKSDNVDVEWTLTKVVVRTVSEQSEQSVRLILDNREIARTHRVPKTVQVARLLDPLRHELILGGGGLSVEVAGLLAAMEECGVPPGAGRPTAGRLLRERGHRFTAADLAQALKVRK